MSEHPLNLALRFLLEMTALYLLGRWGWGHEPWLLGLALAVLAPGVAGAAWGIFRVPNDGGPPVIEVAGRVRLTLEAAVLGGATLAAWASGHSTAALVFGGTVALHYALSWDRTLRLLRVPTP